MSIDYGYGLPFPPPKEPVAEPLSFRDQCAIAAFRAVVNTLGDEWFIDKADMTRLATRTFDLADAMEAERQKRSGR